jgi:hypothetical protein
MSKFIKPNGGIYEEFNENGFSKVGIKNNKNKFMNGIFKLDWSNIRSALVYGLLSGLLSLFLYAISVGDIFALGSHAMLNAFVYGGLGSLVSLIKNLLTTNQGSFLGVTNVIPDKTN